MSNLKKLILTLLCAACGTAVGQTYTTKMQHCVTGGGVVLRWAPADYATWRVADTMGYTIKRYTILRNGEVLAPEEIQNPANILTAHVKVAPIDQWEPFADDKYVAIAAECLYGEVEPSTAASTARAIYQQYRQQQQRFAFALYAADMSPKAAELSGLMYTDTRVNKNEKYLYHVFLANLPDTIRQDTAMDFVNPGIETPMANLPAPEARSGNLAVNLQWDVTIMRDYYTAYIVERSDDGGATFQALSDENVVSITGDSPRSANMAYYTDSLPVNNVPFLYRIRGVDCFGRISQPSDSVEACAAPPLDMAPTIVNYNVIDNRNVELEWYFPDSLESSVLGFRVYSQSGPSERLHKIFDGADPRQRRFVDLMPDMTNYYKVSAYNTETEKLSPYVTYVGLIDSFPPAPPVELVGSIDTAGIATLSWKANTEKDLAGYRVYSANLPNTEFALITNSIFNDTVFQTKVNLNTLTRKIYYQVRAIDARDNLSGPSETLELSRPDTIPPTSPLLRAITADANGFPKMEWVGSSSSDVAAHIVRRRQIDDSVYTNVWTAPQPTTSLFVDSTADDLQTYLYQIVAVDESGNQSKPSESRMHKVNLKKSRIALSVFKEVGRVTLKWASVSNASYYVVFRAVGDEPLKPYSQSQESQFADTRISFGDRLRYAVKAVYVDGSESLLSEVKEIK